MTRHSNARSAPCEGLIYDVEAAVLEEGRFEVTKHYARGPMLVIELVWMPSEETWPSLAAVRRDFFATFGGLSGSHISVDEQQEESRINYYVIESDEDDHHTHVMRVEISGAMVSNVLAAYRQIKEENAATRHQRRASVRECGEACPQQPS